jgi:hypothetical protein
MDSSQLLLALLLHELGSGDLANGAAEIGIQLLGGVNITTNRTYKLFHNLFPPNIYVFYFLFYSCSSSNRSGPTLQRGHS